MPPSKAIERRHTQLVAGGARSGRLWRRFQSLRSWLLGGRPALRRECEPGIHLAEALSRRAGCRGGFAGPSTDPGPVLKQLVNSAGGSSHSQQAEEGNASQDYIVSAFGTACGRKGAKLQHPGWGGTDVGFLPFADRATLR